MAKIIGYFKMVELDSGFTKQDIELLTLRLPEDKEIIPLSNIESELKANSVAMGFMLNDYYESREDVLKVLTDVCNDWDLETHDGWYEISEDVYIILYTGSNTIERFTDKTVPVEFTLKSEND